jgi:hypothetical protein
VGAPVVAAYAAGQMFYFVATGDNTGAVTLNIDSLGAKAVTRDGSVALAAGDIKSGEVVVVVYDGTRFQVVSQLNSAGNATFANVSITSALNVGGVATFSAGTAAAPSITTTGDTNTGIFFPAADTIAFTEGGVEAARFDSSGNVGIGTSSPSDILTLAGGASGSYGLTINNAKVGGGTKAIFQYDATNAIALVGGNTTNGLAFQTLTSGSLTTKATLDSSGNLGLGVTPSAWSIRALQVGSGFAAWSTAVTNARIFANTYYDGAYKYVGTGRATQYEQDGYHAWYTSASGTAGNTISFTQALTLNANGALVLQGGDTAANGVGVTFPASQSASSNANTLDDYEEGSWTPSLGNVSGGSITYDAQVGKYVKIGNCVYVTCTLDFATYTHTTGNFPAVAGLPFTPANVANQGYSCFALLANVTYSGTPCMFLNPNETAPYVGSISSNGAFAHITATNYTASTAITFELFYFV